MLIRKDTPIPSSEITPEPLYLNRRQFIGRFTGAAAGAAVGASVGAAAGAYSDYKQEKDARRDAEREADYYASQSYRNHRGRAYRDDYRPNYNRQARANRANSMAYKPALEKITEAGSPFRMMETSFFLARQTLRGAANSQMASWREKLFAWMLRNAATAMDFFRLPTCGAVPIKLDPPSVVWSQPSS